MGNTDSDRDFARRITHSYGYVALDIESEHLRASTSSPLTLPDGTIVSIGKEESFHCTEALFSPDLYSHRPTCSTEIGIHQCVVESIMSSGRDFRKKLSENIFLSGGNTQFRGITERMTAQLKLLLLPKLGFGARVKVFEHDSRCDVWTGANILAANCSSWVTKEEYEEMGASTINNKCINR